MNTEINSDGNLLAWDSQFTSVPHPDGNAYLQGIEATPEPATMTVLALGGLAILRKRRKQ